MITLRELAAWEDRLGAVVDRASGTLEERDHRLEREGIYAEYAAVFSSYVALVSEDPDGLEALKRAAFLAWYATAEPSGLTGVGDLPDSTVRRVLEALDAHCGARPLDEELGFMVPWYFGIADFVFTRLPGLRRIEALSAVDGAALRRRLPGSPDQFRGRGLMGSYWRSVVHAAARSA